LKTLLFVKETTFFK